MKEIWKDVIGYEKYFRVSNLGNVWSKRSDKKLALTQHQSGYMVFCTRLEGRNSRAILLRVLRLVADAFVPNPFGKPYVNHMDGIKNNNFYKNLEWVTQRENSEHALRIGLLAIGTRNPSALLNDENVTEARHLYSTGNYTHEDLAEIYGVAETTIRNAINYDTWKHVK